MNPPFPDLAAAGAELARALECYRSPETIVLALVRGGAPVAVPVAKALDAPLDLVILRKLLVPEGPHDLRCAVSVAGNRFVDLGVPIPADPPEKPIDFFLKDAFEQLTVRQSVCRGNRPAMTLKGKRVLLIDNGVRSGGTFQTAVRAIRSLQPSEIIGAIAVGVPEARSAIEPVVEKLICLHWIPALGNVAMGFKRFDVPLDTAIAGLVFE